MKIRAIIRREKLQAHPDGKPHATSARYIATTASVHGVPSFKVIVKNILLLFLKNVNLDAALFRT